ncbi:MAG: hypothetical protein IPJ30_15115 [Acidobacteria bacterium]|nr:hypothetical protein [Acidobacteriota bacterium]
MDRDSRWDRTPFAWRDARPRRGRTRSRRARVGDPRRSFLRGITDEFVQPIVMRTSRGNRSAASRERRYGDLFNHRGDRLPTARPSACGP